jgi:hypothetical protein
MVISTATKGFRQLALAAGRARHSVRAVSEGLAGLRRARSDAPYPAAKHVCQQAGTLGRRKERGALTADLVVAMAILVVAAIPLAFAFEQETGICRARYNEAVAMEIVDGEMEILAAGEWRAFPVGTNVYRVQAAAARNLPAGRFLLTVGEQKLRLEWKPEKHRVGRPVVREVRLP